MININGHYLKASTYGQKTGAKYMVVSRVKGCVNDLLTTSFVIWCT